MLTNEDIIRFQADRHEIIRTEKFRTIENYCLFLIHLKAYREAESFARDKIILDLGCNTGYGTKVISANCKEVIGVDVSPRAISQARCKFGASGIEFQLIDGIKLPFSDQRFDLIICFQVIEHIGNMDSFLSEIRRVLKTEGKAIFSTPNARIRLTPEMKPWNQFHTREFAANELGELLGKYFHVVKVRGLFAEQSLYSIEINRVRKAKENAQSLTTRKLSLGKMLKGILPNVILGWTKCNPYNEL